MSEYHPNKWIIIKVWGDDPHYRVFGSWSGSYLEGSSWRLNSGIEKVTQEDNYFLLHGNSGSVYKCHKDSYGIAGIENYAELDRLKDTALVEVDIYHDQPDMLNFNWKGD